MNGAEVGRLLLLAALAAGCAPQDAQRPAPPEAQKPAQPDAPSPAAAEEEWDQPIPKAAIVHSLTPFLDTAQVAEALRGLQFARESSAVWEVAHEARQQDVRDTNRSYNQQSGAMVETPIDGTTNPSKVKLNEEWQRKAAAHARRDALLLAETHRRFRELFAEKLKLPELPAERLPLRVTVLWNRDSFNSALVRAGSPASPLGRALRLPESQTVLTYHGDDALQALDEWQCADGRAQKECDQVLAAAATAQLLREYSGVRRGEPVDDDVSVGSPWLRKGLSEMFGGVEVGRDRLETLDGADWGHERIVLPHVAAARHDRELAQMWTIAELLRVDTTDRSGTRNVVLLGERLAPGRGLSMAELFTIRAWAFCHFLWNYDGGKYRDRLVDYVGRALDGTATSERFAKEIMGRPDAADWGDVEMEFEWYWAKLLERQICTRGAPNPSREPSTDPPRGTVKDDVEFVEFWAETHPTPKDRPK